MDELKSFPKTVKEEKSLDFIEIYQLQVANLPAGAANQTIFSATLFSKCHSASKNLYRNQKFKESIFPLV